MSVELIYTSAARGLRPNSSGFCTVAISGGMSKVVANALEGMSAYDFLYKLSDTKASHNPPNFAHTVAQLGGRRHSVLSRVGFSGADFSGRANKIAHHVVLSDEERLPLGPAEMMLQMRGQVFCEQYTDPPKELPPRALAGSLSLAPVASGPARTWQQVTGDAGWAGALTEAFVENPQTPAYVIYQPGEDILRLMTESLALLPPQKRWEVSFATYYVSMPAGCFYHWRGVVAGSRAEAELRRFPRATVVDLTKSLPAAADSPYSAASRQGQQVAATPVPVSAPGPSPAEVAPRASAPMARLAEPAAAIPAATLASLTDGPTRSRAAARPNARIPVADKSPSSLFLILTVVLALTNVITLALWLSARKTSAPTVAVIEGPADAGETSPPDSSGNGQPAQPDGTDGDAGPTEPPGPTSPEDDPGEDGPDGQQDAGVGGDTDNGTGPTDPPDPGLPDGGDGGQADDGGANSAGNLGDPTQPLTHERAHATPEGGRHWELQPPPPATDPGAAALGDYPAYRYAVSGASDFVTMPEALADRVRIVPDEGDPGRAVIEANEGSDWTDIAKCRLADGELTVTPLDDPARTGLHLLVIEVAGDDAGPRLYQCRPFPAIRPTFTFGFGANGEVIPPADKKDITSIGDYVKYPVGSPVLWWDLDFAGDVPPNDLGADLCEWSEATSLPFAMSDEGRPAFTVALGYEEDPWAAYVTIECDRLQAIAVRARSVAVAAEIWAITEDYQVADNQKDQAVKERNSAKARVLELSPPEDPEGEGGSGGETGGGDPPAPHPDLDQALKDLDAAEAKVNEIIAGQQRLANRESALRDLEDFDPDLKNHDAERGELKKELGAIRQAVEGASPVTIVDPWGMPVLQVELVFELPGKEGEDVIDTIGQRSALSDIDGGSE